ncbi:hypothetical protein F511_18691 [Dorcoceras hygrometricum]|uniref:Uncharacterized protein n=1 Tax=Dorcoceras hygrometricum TaxID=472368 RepID=A0A2Z7B6E5_9LAMI|nr:hypothetical protein F511_18691 [Dorcoceras hygrometricum]
MRTRGDKRSSRKHDRKVLVAEESTKSWADTDTESSSYSSSSSDSEQEEVHCLMADQTSDDELSHSFEEMKAENISLKNSSIESSSEELEDIDSLKTELSKLMIENDLLRKESSELKAEVENLTKEMSSWNQSARALHKPQEIQKSVYDRTGLGFSSSESSEGETSTQSQPAYDKFNKMIFVKANVIYDCYESITFDDQNSPKLNDNGKAGIDFQRPENSKPSWLKNKLDKDKAKAGSKSFVPNQPRRNSRKAKSGWTKAQPRRDLSGQKMKSKLNRSHSNYAQTLTDTYTGKTVKDNRYEPADVSNLWYLDSGIKWHRTTDVIQSLALAQYQLQATVTSTSCKLQSHIFDFSNVEFTREDLVSALNDMVKEYRKLSHSFEEAKAENISLKSSSIESSSDELEDIDSLKIELRKLTAENDLLRNESSELKAEVEKTKEMSSWNQSARALHKLHEIQKSMHDRTGLGFNISYSSEGETSTQSQPAYDKFNKMSFVKANVIYDCYESIIFDDQNSPKLSDNGKAGIGFQRPKNSKSSWLKNKLDKDKARAGSKSFFPNQPRRNSRKAKSGWTNSSEEKSKWSEDEIKTQQISQ